MGAVKFEDWIRAAIVRRVKELKVTPKDIAEILGNRPTEQAIAQYFSGQRSLNTKQAGRIAVVLGWNKDLPMR